MQVKYFYARDYNGNISGTYALVRSPLGLAMGYARVHPNEQGSKAVGREHALDRAADLLETLRYKEILLSMKFFPTDGYPKTIAVAAANHTDDEFFDILENQTDMGMAFEVMRGDHNAQEYI